MNDLLSNEWLVVAVPVATAFLCFASALGISSILIMNKGAKLNYAWTLFGVGVLLIGVSEGDRVMAVLGLPNLTELRDVVRLCGVVLIFSGVAYGRDQLKRLLK